MGTFLVISVKWLLEYRYRHFLSLASISRLPLAAGAHVVARVATDSTGKTIQLWHCSIGWRVHQYA
jgi:hypothetical protein